MREHPSSVRALQMCGPAVQSVTREPLGDDTLLSLAVNGFTAFTRLSCASRLEPLAPSIAAEKCYFVLLFAYCFHNDVPINSDCMPITRMMNGSE
jgi:hypothetical protein